VGEDAVEGTMQKPNISLQAQVESGFEQRRSSVQICATSEMSLSHRRWKSLFLGKGEINKTAPMTQKLGKQGTG